MNILLILHGISFQEYPQTTFLVPHRYTNIHSHQHKVTKWTWIQILYTCNIYKFNIATVWSLPHLSKNWWDHQKHIFIISHGINLFLRYYCSYKVVTIFLEIFSISSVNVYKNPCFTLAYKNASMKSNWCTLLNFCKLLQRNNL